MDPFLIFLSVVISIVSLVFVVVGIYLIMILRNINKTLTKVGSALDTANYFVHNLSNPLTDVKSLGRGIKTGLSVAEHIGSWLQNRKETDSGS